MRDWRTDAEQAADERERPKATAEARFIGGLMLVAAISALVALWQ